MNYPLLKIEDLRTYFYSKSKQAFIRSVDGVNLKIGKGETLGVVGESGSGKSITALSVMGLLSSGPGVITGKIGFKSDGVQKNLLQDLDDFVKLTMKDGKIMAVRKDEDAWQERSESRMCKLRGKEISMIFQNPKQSMNPFMTVGRQITEAIQLHTEHKERAGGEGTGARMARPGEDRHPTAAVRQLSLWPLGWHVPAGHDRHGAFLRAVAPDR